MSALVGVVGLIGQRDKAGAVAQTQLAVDPFQMFVHGALAIARLRAILPGGLFDLVGMTANVAQRQQVSKG
jgi:hypothetical protein